MKDIGHKGLEAHVLDARDDLSGLEIFVCRVTTAFAKVVDKIPERDGDMLVAGIEMKWGMSKLGDFSQCATLFAEVDDDSDPAVLCAANAFLDGVCQVWFTRTNVGAKDIGTVA